MTLSNTKENDHALKERREFIQKNPHLKGHMDRLAGIEPIEAKSKKPLLLILFAAGLAVIMVVGVAIAFYDQAVTKCF